jgi:hypothetical protein
MLIWLAAARWRLWEQKFWEQFTNLSVVKCLLFTVTWKCLTEAAKLFTKRKANTEPDHIYFCLQYIIPFSIDVCLFSPKGALRKQTSVYWGLFHDIIMYPCCKSYLKSVYQIRFNIYYILPVSVANTMCEFFKSANWATLKTTCFLCICEQPVQCTLGTKLITISFQKSNKQKYANRLSSVKKKNNNNNVCLSWNLKMQWSAFPPCWYRTSILVS